MAVHRATNEEISAGFLRGCNLSLAKRGPCVSAARGGRLRPPKGHKVQTMMRAVNFFKLCSCFGWRYRGLLPNKYIKSFHWTDLEIIHEVLNYDYEMIICYILSN